MTIRRTIGERMLERLDSRDQGSARLQRSTHPFEARFERYARTRGISRLGSFMFPDEIVRNAPFTGDASGGDPTLLSSAPYWDRMQRLGNARLRRQQRLAALSNRAARFGRLNAFRRMPDTTARSLPFLGLPSLLADGFEVLHPLPPAVDELAAAPDTEQSQRQGRDWVGAQTSSSPWLSRPFTPARVASPREKQRPLERLAQRAPASKDAVERVRKELETSTAVPARSKTKAPIDEPESTQGRTIRRAQKSMRGRSNPTRMVAVDYEAALPDDFLPPTRHAQGRLASKKTRRRGLRSAMSSSPLMAALEPTSVQSDQTGETVAPAARRTQTASIGRTVGRRTAHRQPASARDLLSASPVRAPAMVAPSALTVLATEANLSTEVVPETRQKGTSLPHPGKSVEASPRAKARARAKTSPMVRALHRAESAPDPVFERPLTARAPIASHPVKTRSGLFAPERSVLTPDVVATEVTEDATPVVAERAAKRRSASANAVHRAETPLASQSVEPVAHSERRAVRPHRLSRTAADVFAPEAATLAQAAETPVERAAVRAQPETETTATTASTNAERIVSRGVEDVQPTRGHQPKVRRPRVVAPISDSQVLAPLAPEVDAGDEADLSQGMHAAARATRTSVVGRSARKVIEASAPEAQKIPAAPTAQRRVAPKFFRSPLSHIQVRKGTRPAPQARTSGTVTLAATPESSVGPGATQREAQSAAIGQVQRAWEHSGRPLDWTQARIEVIQVAGEPAKPSVEPARAHRTVAGAYVPTPRPSRARGTTRGATVMSDQGTTLAQPEAARVEAESQESMAGSVAPIDPTAPDTISRNEARRTSFDSTMGGVGTGQVHQSMPIWAQRSTGRPRIAGGDDLVQQLARAAAPEDVVSVLMDQSDSARRATSSLPQPVVQVIQQIRTEAARAEGEAQQAERKMLETETVRKRTQRRQGVRSTTRVARGMTGINPGGGSARGSSASMDRVSKLAKRLQELIAMAESQNRSGARQQVRMAEDSGAAKSEGQSAPTSAADAQDASADIDTLAREVTEQVTRELEMRRERRQEDPDGRSIWW